MRAIYSGGMLQTDLVRRFAEMATLLELTGANPFRVRAYAQGARVVEQLTNVEALLQADTLTSVPGIGKGLAEQIVEFAGTGRLTEYDALRAQVPAGVLELLAMPGLGAKKVRTLWKDHEIASVAALEAACRAHLVAAWPGFGEKSEEKLLRAIVQQAQYAGKRLGPVARGMAEQMLRYLREHAPCEQSAIAGSLRRCVETVCNIDIVVGTHDAVAVRQALEQAQCTGVTAHCVTPEQYPYALLHFTGSEEHHIALRGIAQARGLTLNECGLWRETKAGPALVACADEAAIYAALDLAYVPPELRENLGEIELAAGRALPQLVDYEDIRGVFHNHTTASDGTATLPQMAAAVQARGWSYLGISDHSQTAHYAGGLTPAQVRRQWEEIAQLNHTQPVHIFRGIESEILKDGSLDYEDALLAQFDFVIVSLHVTHGQRREVLTERTCRALRHPATRILAHPTGRLLLSREPSELDMDAVLRVAGQEGVVVEINANPRRAELDWRLAKLAREYGVTTMVSPDAHRVDGLDDVRSGIGIARKGGWEARDVVNTWTLPQVKQWLEKK